VTIAVAALLATLAALIAGEYELAGFTPLLAAIGVGFALGELISSAGRSHGWVALTAAAVLTAASLAWAAWISSGQGVADISTTALAAPVLGAAVAALTVRSSARPGSGTADDQPGS
jgi:hypothetical protein